MLNFTYYSVDEKLKLKNLLNDSSEAKAIKDRIDREIEYDKAEKEALTASLKNKNIPDLNDREKNDWELRYDIIKDKPLSYFSDVVSWLKKYNSYNNEGLCYNIPDKKYEGKGYLFYDFFILLNEHVRHLKGNTCKKLFYNDKVDEWFKNGKKNSFGHFFPCECFLFKIGNDLIEYREMSGDGIICSVTYINDFYKYVGKFFITVEEAKSKIIELF